MTIQEIKEKIERGEELAPHEAAELAQFVDADLQTLKAEHPEKYLKLLLETQSALHDLRVELERIQQLSPLI